MAQNDMPPFVDPRRRATPPPQFSVDKIRQEMLGLPGQLQRFGRSALTGVAHLPFDLTAGSMDLANLAGNVMVPGQPFSTTNRPRAIDWAAQRGLTPQEPTGAGLPGYLFGGVMSPYAWGRAGTALNVAEQAAPGAVRAAMPSTMPSLPRGIQPLFPSPKANIMVGEGSPAADRGMLQVAKEAEKKGLPERKILDATGWERAKNGMWQTEIAEDQMRMTPQREFFAERDALKARDPKLFKRIDRYENMTNRLSDVEQRNYEKLLDKAGLEESYNTLGANIHNPQAYAAVPGMRDMQFWAPRNQELRRRGSIDIRPTPEESRMTVNPALSQAQQRNTAVHEGSHYAAAEFGLPQGDNYMPIMAQGKRDRAAVKEQLDMYNAEATKAYDRTGPYADMPQQEWHKQIDDLNARRTELLREDERLISESGTPKAAFQTYHSRAGEADARNQGNRQWMTGDYRKMLPSRDTIGLDQRFRKDQQSSLLNDLFGVVEPALRETPGPFVKGTPWEKQTLKPEDHVSPRVLASEDPTDINKFRQQKIMEGMTPEVRAFYEKNPNASKEEVLAEIQRRVTGELTPIDIAAKNKAAGVAPTHNIGDRFAASGADTPRLEIMEAGYPTSGGVARYRVKQTWPDGHTSMVTLSDDNLSYAADRKMTGPKTFSDELAPSVDDVITPGVQSPDAPSNPALGPNKQAVYDAIKADVVAAVGPRGGEAGPGVRGPQHGPFARTTGGVPPVHVGGRDIQKLVAGRYQLDPKHNQQLGALGQSTDEFLELNRSAQANKAFRDAALEQQKALGKEGAQVEVKDSYTGMRTFLSPDGKSGFAIKPDGDLVSVFSAADAPKGRGTQMSLLATQEGARKLDAFDRFLPEKVYNPAGYQESARVAFDPAEAPPGWELGSPDIAGMTFTPDAPRPYVQGQPTVPYPSMLEAQKAELWAPEMTPGVSRQLHETTARPVKQGTRPTVRSPQNKMFPRVYHDPRAIVDRGAANVAPENPLLQQLTGMNRRDFDAAMLERDKLGNAPGMLTPPVSPRGAPYVQNLNTPANTQRLQDVLSLAMADDRLAGSYGWYQNDPLREMYKRIWGPERGAQEFDLFMQRGSAVSPAGPVPDEIRRASLMGMLDEQGRGQQFIKGNLTSPARVQAAFPDIFPTPESAKGYSNIYHSTAHAPALQRIQDTGTFYGPETIRQAPKTPMYNLAKIGQNVGYGVGDAHQMRSTGMVDVRPPARPGQAQNIGSVGGTEAEAYSRWFDQRIAQPLGLRGVGSQALNWNAFAPSTGVKTPVGKGFTELVIDAAEREAKTTGQDVRTVLEKFILKKGKLGAAAATALGMSTMQDQRNGATPSNM